MTETLLKGIYAEVILIREKLACLKNLKKEVLF